MKQYHIILYIAFIAVLVSCKKENAPSVTAVNKTTQQKLQTWFENQSKLNPSGIQPVLGSNTPNWGETEFVEGENMFITPVVFNKNRNAAKYFVANTSSNGEIKSGNYFVFLNKAGVKRADAESIILSKSSNSSFTGSVLEYNMKNQLISSKRFNGGQLSEDKMDVIVYKPTKKSNAEVKTEEVNNLAPLECEGTGQFCIDWYWQTYVNGVLVQEEYLYSTCYCSGGGNGGTNQQAALANSLLAPALNVVTSNILNTCAVEFETQQTKSMIYYWQCATHPTYKVMSTERGNLIRTGNTGSSNQWKFDNGQGLQHLTVTLEGFSLGASVSVECTYNNVIYSSNRYNATITLGVKVTASTTINGVLYQVYTNLNPSKNLYANNSPYALPGY